MHTQECTSKPTLKTMYAYSFFFKVLPEFIYTNCQAQIE